MTGMTSFISRICAAITLLVLASTLSSNSLARAESDFENVSNVSIIPGWQRADGYYMAALQIELAKGWKTYWRSPGENGIAPLFDWSRSENLSQVGYFWPSPNIMDANGVRTIGYEKQLVLPLLLKPRVLGEPMTLRLDLDYGVCKDICKPARTKVSFTPDRSEILNRDLIDASLALRSTPASAMGLQSATCDLRPSGEDFVLRAAFKFNGKVAAHRLVVVETGSDHIWVSEADHTLNGKSLKVEADLAYFGEGAMTLDRSALKFTLLNDGQSIEIVGCSGN